MVVALAAFGETTELAHVMLADATPVATVAFDVTLLALASVRGLGRVGIRGLVDTLGELSLVWSATAETLGESLKRAKVPDAERIAGEIDQRRDQLLRTGQDEVDRLRVRNIHVLAGGDLPPQLQRIPDAPRWLFVEGNVDALFRRPGVAVVGTRQPTPEGRVAAAHVARVMASYPITLISGLAEGIDAEAHRVSLQEGLVNVAFLGHGVDVVFPAETDHLRNQIADQNGAVATEYFPKERYQKQYFVERNRLQAALADIVVPVQANPTGGTAHTLRFARKYRRPIIGIAWEGANGILHDLGREGAPIINITSPSGRRLLDARFRALTDAAGEDSYALARVERVLRAEAASRNVRESDIQRLIKELMNLSEKLGHG